MKLRGYKLLNIGTDDEDKTQIAELRPIIVPLAPLPEPEPPAAQPSAAPTTH